MSIVYKVWVEIEKCDYSSGEYKAVSPYPVCAGEFASIKDADLFIVKLTGDSSIEPKDLKILDFKNKNLN